MNSNESSNGTISRRMAIASGLGGDRGPLVLRQVQSPRIPARNYGSPALEWAAWGRTTWQDAGTKRSLPCATWTTSFPRLRLSSIRSSAVQGLPPDVRQRGEEL